MKKLLLSSLLAFLAISVNVNAQKLKCGSYTTDEFPFETLGYHNYSWSAGLYMPTQLGGAQTMSSITMRLDNKDGGSFNYSNIHIYVRHTTANEYTASSHPDPNYTGGFIKVFRGTLAFNSVGTYTFSFGTGGTSSLFNYNGVDNLEVLIEDQGGSDNSWNNPWYNRTDPTPYGHNVGKVGGGWSWNNARGSSGSFREFNLAIEFNKEGDICRYPLPVELASSSLKCDKEKTKIVWQTKSELNNDYFTIEYSEDGKEWRNIKEIKGAGNSTQTIDYEVEFENNNAKTVYYRLSQTDFDGTHVKLNTFSSSCTKGEDLMVYPNPAKSLINVVIDGGINEQEIQLINSVGQVQRVSVQKDSFNSGAIDISSLPSGVYYVKYNGGDQNEPAIKRIVKL